MLTELDIENKGGPSIPVSSKLVKFLETLSIHQGLYDKDEPNSDDRDWFLCEWG